MTRIDTDLYYILCVMASIGTVAVGVMLIMLADEAWELFKYWRGGNS